MGRSNAAHEPSMEEILASIRKIIESGEDGGAERATDVPRLAAPVVDPDRSPVRDPFSPTPVAALLAEQREAPVAEASLSTERSEATSSLPTDDADDFFDLDFSDLRIELEQELAEVAPHVATPSAPSVDVEPVQQAAPATPRQPEPPVVRIFDVEQRVDPPTDGWMNRTDGRHAALRAAATVAVDRQAAAMPRLDAFASAPFASSTPTAVADPAPISPALPQALRPANSDDPRMNEFRAAIIEDAARLPAAVGAQLLSDRSGGMVSASFDELTRAIRDGQLRSMETMAEDLMRPMLQEWLDDNLPRLVERLVREEIERVARGGR